MPKAQTWQESVKRDTTRLLERAEEVVTEAEEALKLARARRDAARITNDCPHANRDSGGVFGTTCYDCGYFFNDGGF
jgi:hypothetical protein